MITVAFRAHGSDHAHADGAAIAAAVFRRRTAHAVPAGILAANVPDADIVTAFGGGGYARWV